MVVLIPERNVFVHVFVHVFAVVKFMIFIDQSVKQWWGFYNDKESKNSNEIQQNTCPLRAGEQEKSSLMQDFLRWIISGLTTRLNSYCNIFLQQKSLKGPPLYLNAYVHNILNGRIFWRAFITLSHLVLINQHDMRFWEVLFTAFKIKIIKL